MNGGDSWLQYNFWGYFIFSLLLRESWSHDAALIRESSSSCHGATDCWQHVHKLCYPVLSDSVKDWDVKIDMYLNISFSVEILKISIWISTASTVNISYIHIHISIPRNNQVGNSNHFEYIHYFRKQAINKALPVFGFWETCDNGDQHKASCNQWVYIHGALSLQISFS